MNKTRITLSYIFFDLLSAIIAWSALFVFRKLALDIYEPKDWAQIFNDSNFWWGIIIVPIGWLCLYWIVGAYRNVLHKSRLKELQETFTCSILGVIVIFFALMLDDLFQSHHSHYISLLFLFAVHFTLTYISRLIQTSRTVHKVHTRQLGFPTLMIGSKDKAYKTYCDLDNQEIYSGNLFLGFVTVNGAISPDLAKAMPHLGSTADLKNLIHKHHIEEVIIAIEDYEQEKLKEILRTLDRCGDLTIKITPDIRDLILGLVKMQSIFHSPLITINNRLMPEWQYSIKRLFDIIASILFMLVFSPVYLITAIIIKCTSPGPIFYAQERIGYHGKPFKMHKFRSMYIDAEKFGPALSQDNDPRITPFGRFMRKVRLDEIPQFYNVLKGTMSIVGPRPERQFFIDKITERAPEYLLLQRIKPGITSWGQVKYGYASNVDEMLERLKYDLLYLENMSIATDIKILLYTIIIIFQGRGK